MIRLAVLSFCAAVLLSSAPAFSQGDGAAPPEGRRDRNASPLVQRFLATAPQVGEPLPDVTIYDDQGNPVDLRALTQRGRYTVLTFGCLT